MKFVSACSLTMILAAGIVLAQDTAKPRVFISDSQSWEMSGGGGGSSAGFGGASSGGARPQTAEIIKTFGERCPKVTVNNKQDKADYVVLLDHEGGKGLAKRDNKVAVFNKDGDSILSHSTRSLGNAVKDACEAISKDWPARAYKSEPAPTVQPAAAVGGGKTAPLTSQVAVSSAPDNADIELDGSFVGNTPSTIELTPGDHVIRLKKTGYKTWERTLRATGGSINLSAELEKTQ
jgi:hypothetical protein